MHWVPLSKKGTANLNAGEKSASRAGERSCLATPPRTLHCQDSSVRGPEVTSCAISPGEVSTLDHEVLDDTMELAVFVAKSFLERGKTGRENEAISRCQTGL